MTNSLISLLAFIVTLGVLITVHEFGHFWVARRLGVRVLRFSVGFGRPLWRRRGRDGVEYVVAALPLGGYVKMLDEREGEVAPAEAPRAFNRQPVGSRIAIVLAGPLCNFLFAIVAYSLMFVIGVPGIKPLLDEPKPGSLAAAGGFRKGDLVVAVDGKRRRRRAGRRGAVWPSDPHAGYPRCPGPGRYGHGLRWRGFDRVAAGAAGGDRSGGARRCGRASRLAGG